MIDFRVGEGEAGAAGAELGHDPANDRGHRGVIVATDRALGEVGVRLGLPYWPLRGLLRSLWHVGEYSVDCGMSEYSPVPPAVAMRLPRLTGGG